MTYVCIYMYMYITTKVMNTNVLDVFFSIHILLYECSWLAVGRVRCVCEYISIVVHTVNAVRELIFIVGWGQSLLV